MVKAQNLWKDLEISDDSRSILSEIFVLVQNSSVRLTSYISDKISYIRKNHPMHFLVLRNMSIKFSSNPQIYHLVDGLHCRQTSSSKGWPNPTSKYMINEFFKLRWGASISRFVCRSVCRSVHRKFERAFLAQLQINTYFTYGMMRRRRTSRGGEGDGGRGEDGGGCSHIVMVQAIPELIAYPCLFFNWNKKLFYIASLQKCWV